MIVVDASIWVSGFLPQDRNHRVSRRWLESRTRADEALAIPALALTEIAGAIARRLGSAQYAEAATGRTRHIRRLRIVRLDVRMALLAAQIAADLRLRGADAVYVAVAHALNAPLATLDRELQERSSRLVPVILL